MRLDNLVTRGTQQQDYACHWGACDLHVSEMTIFEHPPNVLLLSLIYRDEVYCLGQRV